MEIHWLFATEKRKFLTPLYNTINTEITARNIVPWKGGAGRNLYN